MKIKYRSLRAGKRFEQQQEINRLRASGVTVIDAASLPSGTRCELRGISVDYDVVGRMRAAADDCEMCGVLDGVAACPHCEMWVCPACGSAPCTGCAIDEPNTE